MSAEFSPLPPHIAEFFDNVSIPQGADEQADETAVREADREQYAHGGEVGHVLVLAVHAGVRGVRRCKVAVVLTATPNTLRRPLLVWAAVTLRPNSFVL